MGRFRVVKPIDPAAPAVDDVLADWLRPRERLASGSCCGRSRYPTPRTRASTGRSPPAGRHGLPVNFLCWGRLDDGTEVVRRNPDAVIVIDHLGLLQPSQLEYGITPRNGGLT